MKNSIKKDADISQYQMEVELESLLRAVAAD
jgi:hypothetical protein